MSLSKCAVHEGKKPIFITERKASWKLSSLGIKTPFSKIH